ncbi:unnamed protein product [Rotaria socialis]|uniref:G-protein coupled receptors family 1 profile domain-containing protein n=1 Tax=Rotaria socialis TaxID=392032 RepID=A0A817TC84_9BILA|nr:unnamed protein product [Rotaria socialis]CAF3317846.1 unnamed protein product [Rotaria socialis]CAF3551976.1 unnamed protein product [Rotaria socialis]CAF3672523.1 unnamed protein product [Rotaria socialis]CAF3769124.1 unnamed protein product [Rotaria socialis]
MESSQTSSNLAQIYSLSCQQIEEILKGLNTSEYESKNATIEGQYISLRSPHCEPKPYPVVHGLRKWSVTIILVIFLVFGLIGNTLSATIMFRRSRRGLSSYFYLGLLAIIDICILYTGCLLYMLETTFNYRPQIYSTFICRLAFYIQHLFTYISAWLIVAVTFERFMVVRFPFSSIRICRMHVAYRIAIMIFIFFSLYSTHYFFTMNLIHINLQTDAGYHPNYIVCDVTVHQNLFAFIDLCFYSILPSILILIFNLLIIITIFHAIRKRRDYLQANSYTPSTNTSQRNKNKSSSTMRTQFLRSRSAESVPVGRSPTQFNKQRLYHIPRNNKFIEQNNKPNTNQKHLFGPISATGIRLTCLLLIVSFIFVICTLPISIRSLIAKYLPSQRSTAHWQIIQVSLTLLMYLNHAANFILYCVTGRSFRSECRKLICNLWLLKELRISCTMSANSDKNIHYQHQRLILMDRNRYVRSQQQQQHYMSPIMRGRPL